MRFGVVLNIWRGDSPSFLRESLQSITSQSSSPDEFVVVADGPITDQLEAVLGDFSPYITKVLKLTQNRGLAKARNYGLAAMSSEYVLVQDADDISHPQRIEACRQFVQASPEGVTVLSTDMQLFESSSRRIISMRKSVGDESQLRDVLRFRNPINHPTVMLERQRFLHSGGYQTVDRLEDYATWAKLLTVSNVSFKFLPLPLVAFRMTDDYYRRRGGMRLLRSELELQKFLSSTISDPPNVPQKLCRMFFTAVPSPARKLLDRILSMKSDTEHGTDLSTFLCSPLNLHGHIRGGSSA